MSEDELSPEESSVLQVLSDPALAGQISVSTLATRLSKPKTEIKKLLGSLERKRYIRIRSLEEPISTRTQSSSDSLLQRQESILMLAKSLKQLELLSNRKRRVSERVYQKIQQDIIKRMETTADELAKLDSAIEESRNEILSQIQETNETIQEKQLRAELGELSKEEADRQILELGNKLKELEETRKKLSSSPMTERITSKKSELDKLNSEWELLWARHQVGELSDEAFARLSNPVGEARNRLQGEIDKGTPLDLDSILASITRLSEGELLPSRLATKLERELGK